jgi:hypothetical protein
MHNAKKRELVLEKLADRRFHCARIVQDAPHAGSFFALGERTESVLILCAI